MSQTVAEQPNKVTIADAGPSRKKIFIEIPAETVTQKLRDSLNTLAIEAALPGFRPGKAPRALIEKRFGDAIRKETKGQLVADAYSKAVEESKLKVIGDPVSETLAAVELADGKPLVFELEVEVLPEFELPTLDGVPVKKPIMEVTDAMIDEETRKLSVNEGDLEQRQDPEPADYLTGHAIMTGPDGAEYYNLNGAVVQVPPTEKQGKGMILGVMVEDFSAQFGLPKAGQTATIKVKGPEGHEVEKLRGVDLTITFKVDRVDRIIPLAGDKLLARYGYEHEKDLREGIKRRLEQRVSVQQQVAMRQQIANHLLRQTTFDMPQRATAQQAARTLDRRRMELMYRGFEPHQIEEHMAELRASSAATAIGELKLFFILNKAAEQMDIAVDEGEINGRISEMAAERRVRPDKLRQQLVAENRIGGLYMQIREHKTMDRLLAKARIDEMPAAEFEKAMKAEADAARKK